MATLATHKPCNISEIDDFIWISALINSSTTQADNDLLTINPPLQDQ